MLDTINIEILNLLQQNARMSASEIASEVKLSVPAVAERIRKLIDLGYIKDFVAILNAKNMGYDVTAFIVVDCTSSDLYDNVVQKSARNKSILECHSITGEGSHLLKIRAKNSDCLEKVLGQIQSWSGVLRTHTMFVLSTYKETTNIDLDNLVK
ncbi:MAG: Lrp/AsnC family transcriptional regulator [Candidatus Marinimicrobia bacterium]|jgi:Lrp/AsnC family leucine-responsive transcriptional regulator|nr:Lrp/AsnC family transcriptional regulator [Candidatus Neomarinimicrobiota bacterium]